MWSTIFMGILSNVFVKDAYIMILITSTFVPKNPVGNKSSSVQVMACCQEAIKLAHTHPPTYMYMSLKWTIIDSGTGLSPVRRQAITWTNAGLLSIGLVGTNFSEILIRILLSSFRKMHSKMPSAKMEVGAVLPMGRWASSCNNADPVRWYIHVYAPTGINNPMITTLETYFLS